ncbi:MAG: tetratricopeptide repeat protein [Myxococcota bacterium]
MQQDEHTLTSLLTALPEPPDAEAALVEIRKRVDDGEGKERLPPDLFAGLSRREREPDVLVLHPTADSRGRAVEPRRRRLGAAVVAAAAIGAAAAATAMLTRVETPVAPTVAPAHAWAEPPEAPPPSVRPPPTPEPRDELAVAEAVIALGTLHDEDVRTASKPKQGAKRWTAKVRRARRVWRKGRIAYEAGDVEGARAAFRECLTIDAEHSHCLNSLGRLAADDHDPAAARGLFERAVAANANNPYPMVNLATLAMLGRNLDEADALLQSATRVAPELVVVARLRRRLGYLRGRLQAAGASASSGDQAP